MRATARIKIVGNEKKEISSLLLSGRHVSQRDENGVEKCEEELNNCVGLIKEPN